MTAIELVGIVVLLVFALTLPAIGEGVRRRSEDAPDTKVDADVLARLDADVVARRDAEIPAERGVDRDR